MYQDNSYQYAGEEVSGSLMGTLVPLAGYIGLDYLHNKLQRDAIWKNNPGLKRGAWGAFRGSSVGRNQRVDQYVSNYWRKSRAKYNAVGARAREDFSNKVWQWSQETQGQTWGAPRPNQSIHMRQAYASAGRGTVAGSFTQKAFKAKTRTALAKLRLSRFTAAGLGVANFLFIAPLVYDTAKAGYAGLRNAGSMLRAANMGGLNLPQLAATERQRALAGLHNSELNARSALGNEASYMHR